MTTRAYKALPTLRKFHESPAQVRCCVGPVGSGKTTAAAWEVCYYKPMFLAEKYGLKKTRWAIVRNSYPELRDTTQATVFDWFDWGEHQVAAHIYTLRYPDQDVTVEILFRSCDIEKHVRQFKSLELTGFWIDESIEVKEPVKNMLKNRIGRYPRKCPVRFGIETTNPPEVEHPLYSQFKWDTPPPGPMPTGKPLENHAGFWQPPRENNENLRAGYYDDLRRDYAGDPDWIDMYIEGKPGILQKGKLVYNNFRRSVHVADQPLVWSGGELIRGWDNTGNTPAAVVCQMPTAGHMQILKEFTTDREGIVDFTNRVVTECNLAFPGATYVEYADPAGSAKFSKRLGGFTSNAQLMRDECDVEVIASDQNFNARTQAVEKDLAKIDGLLIDPQCVRFINGFMGGYCYPEIGTTGVYGEQPIKNKFSHIHDAYQYVSVKMHSASQLPGITAAQMAQIEAENTLPSMRA